MSIQMLILISSFVITVILNLIFIPYLKKLKFGQIVRDDGPKAHLSKAGTPTMGGIVMVLVIAGILMISAFKYTILVLPLILVVGFGLIGFIDDFKKIKEKDSAGISAKMKMILLFIVSAIYIIFYLLVFNLGTDVIIPFIREPFDLGLGLFIAFTCFVMLATSNAVNLTDGLDGLCTGIVAIVMAFFTTIAIMNKDSAMVILGLSTIGSCLGFLIFNIKPAKVFMGDTGSLALGGIVASMAIIMKMPIYIIIVAIIPLLETLSVAMQVIYFKITKGKRLFKMAPIHHHLELSGMKETSVVMLFWGITIVAVLIAYLI